MGTRTRSRWLFLFLSVVAGCAAEIDLTPMPMSDASFRDAPWQSPDLAGLDCTRMISNLIQCTDVDTKITYETGHLGCKYRADECADREGANSLWDRSRPVGSGREPIVGGKRFDYYRMAVSQTVKDVLGEVKAFFYKSTDPQFFVDSQAKKLLPEILTEYAIARHCGYRFELLIPDYRLYHALLPTLPVEEDFIVREVPSCNPPAM